MVIMNHDRWYLCQFIMKINEIISCQNKQIIIYSLGILYANYLQFFYYFFLFDRCRNISCQFIKSCIYFKTFLNIVNFFLIYFGLRLKMLSLLTTLLFDNLLDFYTFQRKAQLLHSCYILTGRLIICYQIKRKYRIYSYY